MEEAIWVFFSVISILIALGIIANVVGNNDDAKMQKVSDAMAKLEVQCNFVCETTQNNLLSIDVNLLSGMVIYTNNDKICSKYDEDLKCVRCNCQLEDYELNLANSTIAKKFKEHTYKCYFERFSESVGMNCQG